MLKVDRLHSGQRPDTYALPRGQPLPLSAQSGPSEGVVSEGVQRAELCYAAKSIQSAKEQKMPGISTRAISYFPGTPPPDQVLIVWQQQQKSQY